MLPPDSMPQQALASLVRLVLIYRIITVLLSTAYLGAGGASGVLAAVLVAVGLANLLPLLMWERLALSLLRHPTFLAVDLFITIGILLATGLDGPLLSYTFGTAFIAGLLYSWTGAGVFSGLLVVAYGALLTESPSFASLTRDFQLVVGTPSLYVLLALGAAAVRDLLLRQARVEAMLRTARELAAHGEERARLARELHDSVGKTLEGIGLLADALPSWVDRDPARARRDAHALAAATHRATAQARELLAGMRADRLDRPLEDVLRSTVSAWADGLEAAPRLDVDVEAVPGLEPDQRIELLAVLREALRNVQRHSQANHVSVALTVVEGSVVLRVRDDGRGFQGTAEPELLAARGHFGIFGMQERMERLGGSLEITANQPSGVIVTAQVPTRRPQQAVMTPGPPLAPVGSSP